MRSTVMLVVVLTLVCLISALALALVNSVTEDRIAEQKRLAELRAVSEALRGIVCDNDPSRDAITIPEWKGKDDTPKRVCLGRSEGKVIGVAFTSAGEGYGGFITIMMGVDLTGKLAGIEILEHLETPGLGANIESAELFRDQFKGKHRVGSPTGKLKVVKGEEADDNWEIEALTGATVSPRGVVQAVNDGLAMFDRYKDEILAKVEGATQ
jgi:electron transport complex protein RnfG